MGRKMVTMGRCSFSPLPGLEVGGVCRSRDNNCQFSSIARHFFTWLRIMAPPLCWERRGVERALKSHRWVLTVLLIDFLSICFSTIFVFDIFFHCHNCSSHDENPNQMQIEADRSRNLQLQRIISIWVQLQISCNTF
jgi:hypothetical protein